MSFPETIDPTKPLDSDIADLGPSIFRALKQYIVDTFGVVAAPTQQSAAAFSISSGGVVTISQGGATVVSDPTAALGIATKQYVDALFTRLYKTNLQGVTNSTAPDAALVATVTSNQRWHLRFGIYTSINTGSGGNWTVGVSGPSGATYNLGCSGVGAVFGASPTLTIPFSSGTYFEFALEAFIGVTGGSVTLTYESATAFNVLSGSILVANQVMGA